MSITDFCLVDKVRIFPQNNKQTDKKNHTPRWRNLTGTVSGDRRRGTVSVQEAEEPQWNPVAIAYLRIIGCNVAVRDICYLFKGFLFASDFK